VIDVIVEGLDSLWARRGRTLLSTLGIVFGVAAVIAMMAIGEGARREAEALIDQLGILNVQIRAKDFEKDPKRWEEVARKSRGLSERDVAALRDVLPGVTHVGGMRIITARETVPKLENLSDIRIIGAEPDYIAALNLQRIEGRALGPEDEAGARAVCLLGQSARLRLFGNSPAVGQRIRVDYTVLVVVGVFGGASGELGGAAVQGLELEDRTRDVILPLATSLKRFPVTRDKPDLSEVLLGAPSREEVPGMAALAGRVIDRMHHQQADVEVTVPLRLLEQHEAQQRIFNLVMGLIAGISLLVGGIGIMNITLASVLERTREIGIRMAVGAAPRDILLLFLAESALICLVGGLAGIVVGFAIAAGVGFFTGWSTAVSLWSVLLAVGVSVAEGLLFGALPARQAAMLPPTEAVRAG
jgi:putative ABC transport system permease protein